MILALNVKQRKEATSERAPPLYFASHFSDHERKSISVERTFGNTKDPDELFAICKRLCENLAEDVNERELTVSDRVYVCILQ